MTVREWLQEEKFDWQNGIIINGGQIVAADDPILNKPLLSTRVVAVDPYRVFYTWVNETGVYVDVVRRIK